MNNQLVTVKSSKVITTSLKVAEYFGKKHKNVIRDIENKLKNPAVLQGLKIELSFIIRQLPNGGSKKEQYYIMDKDAFTFLVMGFTGEKADLFKLDFIDAFNRMEQHIHSIPTSNPANLYYFDKVMSGIQTITVNQKPYYSISQILTKKLNTRAKGLPISLAAIEKVPGQTSIIRVGANQQTYGDTYACMTLFKKSRMPQAKVLLSYLVNPKSLITF